jgi:integrase
MDSRQAVLPDVNPCRDDGYSVFLIFTHYDSHGANNPYVFVGKVEDHPIQNHLKAFKHMVEGAGLESKLRCHDLRHTHASLIINSGQKSRFRVTPSRLTLIKK